MFIVSCRGVSAVCRFVYYIVSFHVLYRACILCRIVLFHFQSRVFNCVGTHIAPFWSFRTVCYIFSNFCNMSYDRVNVGGWEWFGLTGGLTHDYRSNEAYHVNYPLNIKLA